MREIIYEHLRKAIVYGELKADAMFTDAEIAEEFGVSRTPAREALQKLESNGYIQRITMKGNRVLGISPYELAHSFTIRKALETLAFKYSAIRIDGRPNCPKWPISFNELGLTSLRIPQRRQIAGNALSPHQGIQ